MNDLLYKNFKLTRGATVKKISTFSEDLVNVQPTGFNNTIKWHIGHILTVTEQFMFGFPRKTSFLPENYVELFGNGTKPSDWKSEAPSLEVLIEQLKDQLVRVKEVPAETLSKSLKQPFLGLETFGELANMALFHEANHLGQLQAMKRVIENSIVKN